MGDDSHLSPDAHDELRELLGAYALDAVDGDERVLLEDHLRICPSCRSELASFRETAAHLAFEGSPAPAGVWDRIAAQLEETPPPMRLQVVAGGSGAPVLSAVSRRRQWLWRTSIALVAAAAVLVVFVVVRANGGTSRDPLRAAAAAALADPSSRVAEVQDSAHHTLAQVAVTEDGHGYVLADGATPPTGKVYELWGQTKAGAIVALGVVNGPGVYGISIDSTVTTIMVTVEQELVATPTLPVVASGTLA